jgi:CRP-like cAMP-binding protein
MHDKEYCQLRPIDRTVEFAKRNIREVKEHRSVVLRGVSTFAALNDESMTDAVDALQTMVFKEGDAIIHEGHVGDMFYLIDDGEVVITKRRETKELSAQPIARLGKNSYFGEKALLTQEYRSATVTAATPVVTCLAMSKEVFDKLIQNVSSNYSELQRLALDKVPLFRDFNESDKKVLLSKLTTKNFAKGTRICVQGDRGDSFYILMDGNCSVLIRDLKASKSLEEAVATLYPGDYFGVILSFYYLTRHD